MTRKTLIIKLFGFGHDNFPADSETKDYTILLKVAVSKNNENSRGCTSDTHKPLCAVNVMEFVSITM